MSGETVANSAFNTLTAGVDFDVPIGDLTGPAYVLPAATGDLYAAIEKLEIADLTSGSVGGSGAFEKLMVSIRAHLDTEYKANRISGPEYTKAFIAMVEGGLTTALQFLLGKDAAYWQAITAQVQAQTAQVQLVTARVAYEAAKAQLQLVQFQGQEAKANYALTKMKLATEEAGYDVANFNLTNILPAQENLLKEQKEAARAQTIDTRTDGTTVTGTLGKQKALYDQQITSYKRDAEMKAFKPFVDAWITQKTMDEGTLPPDGFNNASLDSIIDYIKDANFTVTP